MKFSKDGLATEHRDTAERGLVYGRQCADGSKWHVAPERWGLQKRSGASYGGASLARRRVHTIVQQSYAFDVWGSW